MKKMVVLCTILVIVLCASVWSVPQPLGTNPQQKPQQPPDKLKQPLTPPGMAANAQPGPGPRMMPPMFRPDATCMVSAIMLPPSGPLMNVGGEIGLTQEQVDKLRPVVRSTEETMRKLYDKAAGVNRALRDAVMGRGDAKQIDKLLETCQSTELEMAKAEIAAWEEIRTILKPDQMRRLAEMTQRMMMGPRGPMPGGPPMMPLRPGGPGGPGNPADPHTTQ